MGRQTKKKKKNSKDYIVMWREDYTKILEHQGFHVVYDPPGDGNCQFAALAHHLNALSIFRSQTIQQEIVGICIITQWITMVSPALYEHLVDSEFASCQQCVDYMPRKNIIMVIS